MPDAAEHTPIGELGSFFRGRGGTKKDQRRDGLPCVRYGELYTHHDIRIRDFVSFVEHSAAARYTTLLRGDIVFAGSGETHEEIGKGAVYTDDAPAVAGSDTIILRPSSGVDPVFLSYAVNSDDAARFKARHGQGSSVIHIGARHLQKLKVWLPPHPEQRQIAKILDTLDEAIRKTEAIIAKLKQVKQGLLHDLLTRGIDDDGELRDPERHPEQFKDSPLGRIPKAWSLKSVEDLLAEGLLLGVQDGNHGEIHPKRDDFVREGVPFLMANDLAGGEIDFEGCYRITSQQYRSLRVGFAKGGDVLLSHKGTVGETALVPFDRAHVMLTPQVTYYRCESRTLSPWFLLAWMRSGRFQRTLRVIAGQSTREYVGITTQRRLLRVPVPDMREQERIASISDDAERRQRSEVATLRKLRLLKQGLMEDLLPGRVRVTNLLEEAAQ